MAVWAGAGEEYCCWRGEDSWWCSSSRQVLRMKRRTPSDYYQQLLAFERKIASHGSVLGLRFVCDQFFLSNPRYCLNPPRIVLLKLCCDVERFGRSWCVLLSWRLQAKAVVGFIIMRRKRGKYLMYEFRFDIGEFVVLCFGCALLFQYWRMMKWVPRILFLRHRTTRGSSCRWCESWVVDDTERAVHFTQFQNGLPEHGICGVESKDSLLTAYVEGYRDGSSWQLCVGISGRGGDGNGSGAHGGSGWGMIQNYHRKCYGANYNIKSFLILYK